MMQTTTISKSWIKSSSYHKNDIIYPILIKYMRAKLGHRTGTVVHNEDVSSEPADAGVCSIQVRLAGLVVQGIMRTAA